MKSVALFIMGIKGLKVLQGFVETSINIKYVIYAEDKNMIYDYTMEIKDLCNRYSIPVFTIVRCFEIDFIVAAGWRWIIEEGISTIVFHDSLLPKYRGFSPLVNALLKGDSEVGVTCFIANKSFDSGDILLQRKVNVNYPIKVKDIIARIADSYKYMVKDLISMLKDLDTYATKQDESLATYSPFRREEDYRIDWKNWSVNYVKRFIDSMGFPYKGASSYLDDKKVRILDCEITTTCCSNSSRENRGKVIYQVDNCPFVICKDGVLKLTKVVSDNIRKSVLPLKSIKKKFE